MFRLRMTKNVQSDGESSNSDLPMRHSLKGTPTPPGSEQYKLFSCSCMFILAACCDCRGRRTQCESSGTWIGLEHRSHGVTMHAMHTCILYDRRWGWGIL